MIYSAARTHFPSSSHPLRNGALLLGPFYRGENQGPERLRDFPEVTVLVLSGCGTAITKYPRFRNNANSLITVLEAEKSKLKALADSVSSEICFLIDGRLFTITSWGIGGKGALLGLFHEGINPIHQGPTRMT